MRTLLLACILLSGCASSRYAVQIEIPNLEKPKQLNIRLMPVVDQYKPPEIDLRNCKPVDTDVMPPPFLIVPHPNDKTA